MQTAPQQVFTHDYQAEAVKEGLAEGLGGTPVVRKLGLSVEVYLQWVRDARSGVLARLDARRTQPVSDPLAEASRLTR